MNRSFDPNAAFAKGRLAYKSLQRVVELLSKAESFARADYWFSFSGFDLVKYYHLYKARSAAKRSKKLLAAFKRALGDRRLDSEIAVQVELQPGVLLADLVEDFIGDLIALSNIQKSKRKTNIALSRLRRVLRSLQAEEEAQPPAAPASVPKSAGTNGY